MLDDKERLVILSDAIRKMASDAYQRDVIDKPPGGYYSIVAENKEEYMAIWIDNYLCEDLLEIPPEKNVELVHDGC